MKPHPGFIALLWLLGAVVSMPTFAHHGRSQHVNLDLKGWPVADFALVDAHGSAFTQERLRGLWTFVLFGDTRCNEPCTAALAALSGMCRRIAGTAAVRQTQILFVSLDPERDSGETLRDYLLPFDARVIGASGTRQTLQDLAADLKVAMPPPGGGSNGQYAGSLLLIGPDGIVRGELLPPFDVLLLTAEYLKTWARR